MRRSIVIIPLFLLHAASWSQDRGIFNELYLINSPQFKDLTLEENYMKRAEVKMKMIIRTYRCGNVTNDSNTFRKNAAEGTYSTKNMSLRTYYYYNRDGVLYQKATVPLDFRISRTDSIKINSLEDIRVESTDKGFRRYLQLAKGCGLIEEYEGGKLVKVTGSGNCKGRILHIGENENRDTSYSCSYEKKLEYGADNAITLITEHFHDMYTTIDNVETYDYEGKKIVAVKTNKEKTDSSSYEEKNINKLGSGRRVMRSKYFDPAKPRNRILIKCRYDLRKNLDRVIILDKRKLHRKTKIVHFYYYFEKNKMRSVEFSNLKGETYIQFDEQGRFSKVTNSETGDVTEYEYQSN